MENSNFTQLPIYKKALEIFNVSRGIACALSDNKHVLEMGYSADINQQYAGEIVTYSLNLMPELAAIQNSSTPGARLKRAKRIQRSAREILSKCKKMDFHNNREREFIMLLRKELQHFDSLFSEWFNSLQLKHKRS